MFPLKAAKNVCKFTKIIDGGIPFRRLYIACYCKFSDNEKFGRTIFTGRSFNRRKRKEAGVRKMMRILFMGIKNIEDIPIFHEMIVLPEAWHDTPDNAPCQAIYSTRLRNSGYWQFMNLKRRTSFTEAFRGYCCCG